MRRGRVGLATLLIGPVALNMDPATFGMDLASFVEAPLRRQCDLAMDPATLAMDLVVLLMALVILAMDLVMLVMGPVGVGLPRDIQNKPDSTLRTSQAVAHPSTYRALRHLTSEVRKDPVHSTRPGRQRRYAYVGASQPKPRHAAANPLKALAHAGVRPQAAHMLFTLQR